MISCSIEQLDRVIAQARLLRTALAAAQKTSAKTATSPETVSRARRIRGQIAAAQAFEHVDDQAHELHCLIVEAGLAQAFEAEYYGEFIRTWDGCQTLHVRRSPKR